MSKTVSTSSTPSLPLWQLLSGAHPGRRSAAEVTVFDSVGFALEDFSALRFMHDAALALGYGQRLDLIPSMQDPKNLFGTLRHARAMPCSALSASCAV